MDLIEALNSINQDKRNLIRNSGAPKAAEKQYPSFPVARSLSYHPDSILLVDELNQRGMKEHNVHPIMHYEFLLYVIPKRKRYGKWGKPQKDHDIEILMEVFQYSYEKAKDIYRVLSKEQMDEIRASREQGGVNSNGKRKTKT